MKDRLDHWEKFLKHLFEIGYLNTNDEKFLDKMVMAYNKFKSMYVWE